MNNSWAKNIVAIIGVVGCVGAVFIAKAACRTDHHGSCENIGRDMDAQLAESMAALETAAIHLRALVEKIQKHTS